MVKRMIERMIERERERERDTSTLRKDCQKPRSTGCNNENYVSLYSKAFY